MKMLCIWKKIKDAAGALHLADQCLLIIMAILMMQSAHNLFFHELTLREGSSLDVIVRTTAAAIFGYFVSANFHDKKRDSSEPAAGTEKRLPKQPDSLQIVVVAAIGIWALLMLVFAHNHFFSGGATATISQLRDFVSGSVGFLIGSSTHSTRLP